MKLGGCSLTPRLTTCNSQEKITSQGHSSSSGCDLSTLLTCSPLGKEIYHKQPPRIPKPPQPLQGSSLHHGASPRALHQILISTQKAGTSLAFSCCTIPRIKGPLWQNRAPEENAPLSHLELLVSGLRVPPLGSVRFSQAARSPAG